MPVIAAPPESLAGCGLYQRLIASRDVADGLAERVTAFVEAVRPLLDMVLAGPFKEYTLHNPAHATKLVHLVEYVVDLTTLNQLTPLEISVVILASHLHDLGMSLTQKERSQILADPRFDEELRGWPQLWHEFITTRNLYERASGTERLALETRLFQLQEAGLTAFLRPRHATRERYQQLIAQIKSVTGRNDLFSVRGVSFEEELILICMSHNLDVAVLMETTNTYTDRFPRAQPIGGMVLNSQFCAGVLRLVDILDFDRERTPRILFESLGIADRDLPGAQVSLREWNKHMAVHSIELTSEELIVYADSSHPAIERSIKDFCALIEREIRDTTTVLRKNPEAVSGKYRLRLPVVVRPQIRARDYVYKDFAFQLDETAIAKLLMGEGLYSDRAVAFRELIQNGIDACRVRQLVDTNTAYLPEVSVSAETDSGGRTWVVVTDNGIGMDESVLSRFFFRVGNSFYTSSEFERMSRAAVQPFVPISRFGIGILSVFMIADTLEIHTRNGFSPRGDTTYRTIRVDGRFGLAFVTEHDSGAQGTTVRVRLSERNPLMARVLLGQAATYVRNTIVRPPVPVTVDLPPAVFRRLPGQYVGLREDAAQRLADAAAEPLVLDIERWSQRFSGHVILFFRRAADGRLNHLGWKADTLQQYLKGFRGNRLTVNGISMGLPNIGRILGRKGARISGVIDVELRGESEIKYDAARNRLIGDGLAIARADLREAILSGLRELGFVDRLDSDTREMLEAAAAIGLNGQPLKVRLLDDPEILAAVLAAIPAPPWPLGLHHIVGTQLGLRPSIVYRAISALIATGRLAKDNDQSTQV
jgi:hypothetical protein